MSYIMTFILGGLVGVVLMAILVVGGNSDGKD